MSNTIPETHRDLLDEPVYVSLATVMPDGQPQVTVVWCDYDGKQVRVNTARDRQKAQNMADRPVATLLAIDPDNPYRYLEVRGKVMLITPEGALEHINKLAFEYQGEENYYGGVAPKEQQNQELRVICKITPSRVRAVG